MSMMKSTTLSIYKHTQKIKLHFLFNLQYETKAQYQMLITVLIQDVLTCVLFPIFSSFCNLVC